MCLLDSQLRLRGCNSSQHSSVPTQVPKVPSFPSLQLQARAPLRVSSESLLIWGGVGRMSICLQRRFSECVPLSKPWSGCAPQSLEEGEEFTARTLRSNISGMRRMRSQCGWVPQSPQQPLPSVCVCAHTRVHLYRCTWRSEVDIRFHSLLIVKGSLLLCVCLCSPCVCL